jgi:hypothetical protein
MADRNLTQAVAVAAKPKASDGGGASLQAGLEQERLATIARAEREYQLRLPMAPIPHCAGQPRSLARDFVQAQRPLQEELYP